LNFSAKNEKNLKKKSCFRAQNGKNVKKKRKKEFRGQKWGD